MNIYKVQITYPNGVIEIIDEDFYTLVNAKEYGQHLLGQVSYNEGYHSSGVDVEGEKRRVKPYFLVLLKENKEEKIVFDSRR